MGSIEKCEKRLRRKRVPLVCHVCGRHFTASRFDARTCTSTCRQRLRRGQEFAYLAGLTKRQQRAGREMHAAYDKLKAPRKDHVADTRKAREAKREARRQRAEQEREHTIAELTSKITALANFAALLRGRKQLNKLREGQERQQQRMRGTVAGVLKLFDQQQRDDRSAEAIAAFLDMPEYFPVEVVRELLADLQD
jgi:hypothetical protein